MRTLKPIRSNAEHARALREIDKLIAKAPKKASLAFDRLEALTILVEAYERSRPDHRIDESFDPVEAILFHLDRLGKTHKDLEKLLKCIRSRVWESCSENARSLWRRFGPWSVSLVSSQSA